MTFFFPDTEITHRISGHTLMTRASTRSFSGKGIGLVLSVGDAWADLDFAEECFGPRERRDHGDPTGEKKEGFTYYQMCFS